MRLVNIGYGNMASVSRIIAVVSPDSAPVKRLVQDARDAGKLVDGTAGRRTRAVIVTDTGFVILSSLMPETLASRVRDDGKWDAAALAAVKGETGTDE